MNDTLTMTRRPGRIRRSEATAIAVATVLFALLVALASPLLSSAPTVAQVDVDNRTAWPLAIAVRSESDGWIPVGVASARSGTTFAGAPDPGDRWQIRYSYGGTEVVSTLRRDAIAANGWTISVPPEVVEAMEATGADPAPPRGS